MVLCWGRYRDDIFSLWNQSTEKLMEITNYLSSICPNIKFTVRFDHQKLEFLDVLVYKDKGTLHTTVFSKETNGHMYLPPSLAHFHSISRNIPYNVALRLRRICSTQEQFDNKCEEHKAYLSVGSYNRAHLCKQFSRAKQVPREFTLIKKTINSSDNKFIFNLDYNPALRNVGGILRRYLPILLSLQPWSKLSIPMELKPLEFCGYRGDMFDVEITKTKEEINAFTDFLNGLIPGIRFKSKIRKDKIDFLDTMVTIENGYLITSPYSKPMDSKQYLV